MKARVFLSCGQNKKSKREMAAINAIVEALENVLGLTVFVAAKENFFVGNPNIFDSLKDSDYYLFINFERPVKMTGCYCSLYTHQELAMAIAYGFDKTNMLVFHKKGMQKSGILKYMFANGEFKDYSDVVETVIKAVRDYNWNSNYSRHLSVEFVKLTPPCSYNPIKDKERGTYYDNQIHYAQIATVEITNRRRNDVAINCQVHLKDKGEPYYLHYDRAPVKAAGVKSYSHTIWPGETASFDLFGYDVDQKTIFMRTESDVVSPGGYYPPLINQPGHYTLTYEVCALNFPISTFVVELHLGDDVEDGIQVSLCQENHSTQLQNDSTDSSENFSSPGSEPAGTGAFSTSYPNPQD